MKRVPKQSLTLKRLDGAEAGSIEMVVVAVASVHSHRAYRRTLEDFFHWHRSAGRTHA